MDSLVPISWTISGERANFEWLLPEELISDRSISVTPSSASAFTSPAPLHRQRLYVAGADAGHAAADEP